MECGLWTLEVEIWSQEVGIWPLEVGIWSLEVGIWTLEVGIWRWNVCVIALLSVLMCTCNVQVNVVSELKHVPQNGDPNQPEKG